MKLVFERSSEAEAWQIGRNGVFEPEMGAGSGTAKLRRCQSQLIRIKTRLHFLPTFACSIVWKNNQTTRASSWRKSRRWNGAAQFGALHPKEWAFQRKSSVTSRGGRQQLKWGWRNWESRRFTSVLGGESDMVWIASHNSWFSCRNQGVIVKYRIRYVTWYVT